MAGAVIASVPVLVMYAAAQRYVVDGVTRADGLRVVPGSRRMGRARAVIR